FGGGEIEREYDRPTASLPSHRGFLFVGDEAFETSAQKCSETALGRIVGAEKILLDGARKEALRVIRSVVGIAMPFHADEFIYRFPVRINQRFERLPPLCRILALRG